MHQLFTILYLHLSRICDFRMVGFCRVKCLPFFTCCSCNEVDLNFMYIAYKKYLDQLSLEAVKSLLFNLPIFKDSKFKAI